MGRKSLSDDVLEELKRAQSMLCSLQDSSDPIPAILIGEALESLSRIESRCLRAKSQEVADYVEGVKGGLWLAGDVVQDKATQRRAGAHKAPRKPKES